jgi:hypothetical protein
MLVGRGGLLANLITDAFVPSQLIMISEDLLAQYWVNMGHISYYRRVDLEVVASEAFGRGTV